MAGVAGPEYAKDEEGQCFIPSSQRPDGTWRKARRVRDGYVPQEEVPLYESKGKAFAKSKPDHPIGLAPDDVEKLRANRNRNDTGGSIPGLPNSTNTQSSTKQGMSKSQKKKAAAAKKKANATVMEITSVFDEVKLEESKKETKGESTSQVDPVKRLKTLKKKLREIEKLEKQLASGEISKPDPDQLSKVKKKPQVLEEIANLEEEVENN